MAIILQQNVEVERYRFTVAEYERMGEVGIFHEDDRVELIAGEIIKMSPIGDPHVKAMNRLNHRIVRSVGDDFTVSIQNPVRLSHDSEPQPDLTVLRGSDRGLPSAADVILVIEVSDTTLRYDRRVKLPLYAAAGIPEAWIVDVAGQRIERYSEPGANGYAQVVRFGLGETITSTVLPTIAIAVSDILG